MSSAKVENLYTFKREIYDTLEYVFGKTPNIPRNSLIQVEVADVLINGEGQTGRHNFERGKFMWHSPRNIYYGGSKVALAQARPHNQILIYNVVAKNRLARSVLIKTLYSSFPHVKVIYE